MRHYDKVFLIWDKQDKCIARLGGPGYSYKKNFGLYLLRNQIGNSPRAQALLKNKKRFVVKEIQLVFLEA